MLWLGLKKSNLVSAQWIAAQFSIIDHELLFFHLESPHKLLVLFSNHRLLYTLPFFRIKKMLETGLV
jgi:hypothetical protein